MKTTLGLSTLLALLPIRSPADWTVALPQPRAQYGTLSSIGRFGTLVWPAREDGATSYRLIWVSPDGKILLHYWMDYAEFRSNWDYSCAINDRQVALYDPQSRKLRLVTIGAPPNYSVKEYSLITPGQEVQWDAGFSTPPDLTGFSYIDNKAWTLTRVVFPEPPPTEQVELELQSSPRTEGAWAPITTVKVPQGSSNGFFRLKINTPQK